MREIFTFLSPRVQKRRRSFNPELLLSVSTAAAVESKFATVAW